MFCICVTVFPAVVSFVAAVMLVFPLLLPNMWRSLHFCDFSTLVRAFLNIGMLAVLFD